MSISQAVLATLSYHDLFNYPLTTDEIHKYLIGESANFQSVQIALKNLQRSKRISYGQGYYFLQNKKSTVKIRNIRTIYSRKKIKKALFYSKILRLIPTVKLLAVTGALAMENSTSADDVDLMIITAKNSLWTTRLFANIALLAYKRKPNSPKKTNRACLNIFIDESDLAIKEKNLYTAHEVAQMNILWDRDNTYQRFIKANAWISQYLPNWKQKGIKKQSPNNNHIQKKIFSFSRLTLLAEFYFKKIQLMYMRSKITNEKIGERQLFFHPKATQSIIISKYNQKLKRLKIAQYQSRH